MEIAFFTETFPPTRDGVAVEVSELARALVRLGHGVRVFTTHPTVGAPSRRDVVDGIPVVRVRSLPVPLYAEYRWALFPFLRLRGEHLAGVDVVHVHTPGMMGSAGFLSARRYGKPLVGTFHTNVWEMRSSFPANPLVGLFFAAARWYTLGTYWRCDITTAPTDAARRALLGSAGKPFRRAVEVVPNGIEVDRFRPGISVPDWRERCGLPDAPLVTYLGRLTVDKGVHRFLDAVAAIPGDPPFRAVVAGSGPEADRVRARLRDEAELARRVRYLGPVAEEEKPALLAQTSVFVLPSTSDTSSVALLEAMAAGAACVVSSVGGPADIVEDGTTGRVVDPRSSAVLASAIAGLLTDPDGRRRLGEAARRYVGRTASIDATARRFISLYELLLGERAQGARRVAR